MIGFVLVVSEITALDGYLVCACIFSLACSQVFAVDWSPDGERVASGGKDKVLKV